MKEHNLEEIIASALLNNILIDINNHDVKYLKKIISELVKKRVFGIWRDIFNTENIDKFLDFEIDSILKKYNAIYHKNFIDHLESLVSIVNQLDQADIKYTLLKGSALRLSSYEFGYKRYTRDIDILVEENRLSKIYACLKKLDFKYADVHCNDSVSGSLNFARHIPPMINKKGIIIEVHHRVTDPKSHSICPLSKKMLCEFDQINYSNKTFNIPKKEHMCAHLLHHELTQKKENNLILLISDLKNIVTKDMDINLFLNSLRDLKINEDLINKINLFSIDINLINKYSHKNILSFTDKIKFFNHRVSYAFQIPLEKLSWITYIKFMMLKIRQKLLYKFFY